MGVRVAFCSFCFLLRLAVMLCLIWKCRCERGGLASSSIFFTNFFVTEHIDCIPCLCTLDFGAVAAGLRCAPPAGYRRN